MISDEERQEGLSLFSDLYCPDDYNVLIYHMPKFNDDPEGEAFGDYFDFLQSLYCLRGDILEMEDEDHLDAVLYTLRMKAKKFNFPEYIMDGFE